MLLGFMANRPSPCEGGVGLLEQHVTHLLATAASQCACAVHVAPTTLRSQRVPSAAAVNLQRDAAS